MADTRTSDHTPRATDGQHRRPGTDFVDRGLDRFEDALPALPAAVFRVQRSVVERLVDRSRHVLHVVGDAVSSIVSVGRNAAHTADETVPAATEVAATAATAVQGTPMSYEHWTRKDLYELARHLDVDGRSAMDKDELIAAIERSR